MHEALLDTVRKVHGGMRFLAPPVAQCLAARTPNSEVTSLEREVLTLLW